MNTIQFIDQANNRFNNKFDYSLVEYVNNTTPVIIICPIHGEFNQRPNSHLNGYDCHLCTKNKNNISLFNNFVNNANQEPRIHELLKKHNIKFIQSSEFDILIPYFNIAIECNYTNLYKDKNYHLNKTNLANNCNIQLLHFWDFEIDNKLDIIESIITSKCHKLNKIYARKCVIKKVSSRVSGEFLEGNHLQGKCISSIQLGLYYNDELVSLMTFGKPRYNKRYQWELIRFCNKKNFTVIGDASKLFKYFIRHHCSKDDKIISYANKRISNGNLYKAIGFKELKASPPSYFYYKNGLILSRYKTQKHKLESLLGTNNFDSNLSESENMKNNNFLKVYDCGNLVFEYSV